MTGEKFVESPIAGLPTSVAQLEESCRAKELLDVNTVYLPGMELDRHWYTNGRYGIGQLDSSCRKVVAVCGSTIVENNLVIVQTPQAMRREDFEGSEGKALDRLRSRDFRGQMIRQMAEIGRALNLAGVLAVPAARYPNVECGIVDYFEIYDLVDKVLQRCGFELDGQYYRFTDFP